MQVGIFAKTFPETGAGPVLRAVRAAGYGAAHFNAGCLGLPAMPDDLPDALARGVATEAAATGIGIVGLSGTWNMIHPDRAERERGLARLSVLLGAAPLMGAPILTLCTGTRDPADQWRHHPGNAAPDAWADLCASMAKALEMAEAAGVDLGVEPELANVVSDATRARRLLDEMASPRLKIVLDPANLFERAGPDEARHLVARAVDRLAPHIAMAHAKDRAPDGSFVAAGQGVVDFRHFIGCLRGAGFSGPLVTHGLTAAEAPAVAAYLTRVIGDTA